MANDTPGRPGDAPSGDGSATPGDAAGLDWDELLTGRTPTGGVPVAPPPAAGTGAASAPGPDAEDPLAFITAPTPVAPGAQPRSRREAREAEEAAARVPDPVAPAVGTRSRSQRRSERSELYPEREPKRRGRAIGCLVVVLVLVGLVAGGWFALQGPIQQFIASTQGPADYSGSGSGKVDFVIKDGEIGEDIATNLHDQGVTASFDAFYDLLLSQREAPVFQPGAYTLKKKMSAKAALAALEDPANRLENTVVIPEGTAAADVYQSISDATSIPLADVQAAAADVASYGLPPEATSLEGFLFPATYPFTPGVTAPEILKTMVDRSFQALDAAGVPVDQRWRIVTLASIVQREAGSNTDDFPKIARVFQNRLDQGMLLQSDATVAYGTGNTHTVWTTDAERADASNLYNTYVHPGLPVGPIGNPGDVAIDAAMHPADGTWLFFVPVNLDTGETVFSTTAEEHDAAVAQLHAWCDASPDNAKYCE